MKPRHFLNPREKTIAAKRARKRKPHAPKSKRKLFQGKLTPEEERLMLPFMVRLLDALIESDIPGVSAVYAPTTPFQMPLGTETSAQVEQPAESGFTPARPTNQARSTKKKRRNPAYDHNPHEV